MMEKQPAYKAFEKKIVPYLDGSLGPQEQSEFEAFVLTHPEFEEKIKTKRTEIDLIRKMIPVAMMSPETQDSLETEIRASVFNLLKEEPKSWIDGVRLKWEDWTNR